MSNRPAEDLLQFMELWGIKNHEVWQVPGGKVWAVKHSALERVASEQKITFGLPTIIEHDTMNLTVTMLVVASGATAQVWSIGEVAPSNYKVTGKQPGYPWAMAEKRAKDRCILKLLNAHGTVYSDSEADEFKDAEPDKPATPDDMTSLQPINDAMLLQLRVRLKEADANLETFCRYFEVADVAVLPQNRWDEAMQMLQTKIDKAKGAQ